MSQPLAVGDIIQTRFLWTVNNQNGFIIRQYIAFSQTGSGSTVDQFVIQLDTGTNVHAKAICPSSVIYHGVGAQHIWPLPLLPEIPLTVSAGACTGLSANPAPTQVAGIVSWRTSFAGRQFRGRNYFPFPSRDDILAGTGKPTAGYVTQITNLASDFFQGLVVGTAPNQTVMRPILWHRRSHTWNLLDAYTVKTSFATQRRRGDFGKQNIPPW